MMVRSPCGGWKGWTRGPLESGFGELAINKQINQTGQFYAGKHYYSWEFWIISLYSIHEEKQTP
ncbi:hypothetical protein [Gimesia aquarii]|uniref:hypothetical protein n=1 Tax=Gimesia aquarii TaxID=2527964 RepID=UPI00119F9849|nr:hypothetical protein [Gimesia aquarii]